MKLLQEILTAQPPYLNFTTFGKMAHDMHHAMTFIHTYSSHKHKTNTAYTIIYMEIPILGLSQAVGETVLIRFEN